jgi:hypothetical protein
MKVASVFNCEMSSNAKSDAPMDERWTPAQVGRALKIVLYVGVATAFWVLNRSFGGDTTAEDADVQGGPCTPGPKAAANDFSPWEPEP